MTLPFEKYEFESIKSHRAEKVEKNEIEIFKQNHLLNFKMRQSSWNNIPTPLKEMFQFVVDFCINQDIK